MRAIVIGLVWFLLFLLVFFFAWANRSDVLIDFLGATAKMPLVFALFVSFLVGVLATLLSLGYRRIRCFFVRRSHHSKDGSSG